MELSGTAPEPAPTPAQQTGRPPERVGRGVALALLVVPVSAVVCGFLWEHGFGAYFVAVLVAPAAALLYARASGGRVARATLATAGVAVVAVAASFFAVVAVDLHGYYYDRMDAEMASVYGSRWDFVADNLFYPVLLRRYVRTAVLFAVLGVLGELVTVARLVRLGRAGGQRASR